ncbi:hypothetical protein [Vallitalea guaymasensis]|uniref:Secreted protein n=1 Tax=Vallitalea guaymasensis TaxID=1185412 RepID=A0A8J8MBA5_9FIRM|nr:hypothetical protein [Vallitalea guaymasensis]QUH29550.1 hypothetical protein HYG85_11790 [Vallitalea guaymasensis]
MKNKTKKLKLNVLTKLCICLFASLLIINPISTYASVTEENADFYWGLNVDDSDDELDIFMGSNSGSKRADFEIFIYWYDKSGDRIDKDEITRNNASFVFETLEYPSDAVKAKVKYYADNDHLDTIYDYED